MFFVVRKKTLLFAATAFLLVLLLGLSFAALPCVRSAPTSQASLRPTVYLTFDDGPSANTKEVLDLLREQSVRATFFVIGNTQEKERPLYSRIVEEGHAIGIHTYSHNESQVYSSFSAFMEDFHKIEAWIYETSGQKPKICRIPGGTNTLLCPKSLKTQILTAFKNEGYACFDWDIDPLDSGAHALPADKLAAAVISEAKTRAKEDLVILMHDDSLRTTLPQALATIITYFKEQGYRFDVLRTDVQTSSRRT